MADPIITVDPPRRSPRTGDLLDAVEVREVARLAAANRAQYVSEPCNFTFGDAGFCYGDLDPDTAQDKTYKGIDTNESVVNNFAAFYGVECFINDESDVERRAREAFDLAESRHVEAKFAVWLNAAAPVAAAPATVVAAIAAAEDYADKNYIAQPIIFLNRVQATAAVAAQVVFGDGTGRLWTALGTPVVASSAFGNDVWVTGAVTVLASPLVVNEAVAETKNRQSSMAERVYGILVDCDFVGRFDFTA